MYVCVREREREREREWGRVMYVTTVTKNIKKQSVLSLLPHMQSYLYVKQ